MSKITIWGTRSAAVRGGSGITYYVSASGGSDLNDGLSELSPWQTLNKVNAMAAPGTTILFKRGDTWSPNQFGPTMESLHPVVNGSAVAPIIFGSYGSGNLPVVDGAVSIASGSWMKTGGLTNVYQTSISGWEMDDLYKEAADGGDRGPVWEVTPAGTQGKCIYQADRSQADVLAWLDANPGYNYYDNANDVLYLHTPDSTSPITNGRTYRPSVFLRTISSNGKKHVHFSDLKAVYTGQYGFNTWNLDFTVNSDYVSFDGCVTQYSYHDAVALSGRNLLWENGQALDVRGSATLSQHYSKAYVSASPAAPGAPQHGQNIIFRNSTVGNTETIENQKLSTVLPCEMYVGNVLYENIEVDAPSLCLLGNQTTQVGPYNITYRKVHSKSTVSNNFAEYGYTTGMVVENLIYDVMSGNKSTIQFENAINPVFRYSKITGPNTSANGFIFAGTSQNGKVIYNIGISLYVFVDVDNSAGLVVAGNTVYGGLGGVRSKVSGKTATVRNNIFKNVTYPIYLTNGGLINSDYNDFHGYTNFYSTGNKTWAQWQALGYDPHSIILDPLLTDPANGDFTLGESSPCKGAGIDLGEGYDIGIDPSSAWPDSLVYAVQSDGWDMGCFVYV